MPISSFLRKTISAALSVALLVGGIAPSFAATGIDTMLQGIYTAAGQPQYATTTRMNTFSAGYVAVRTNLNNFNIFAVVPPNFSAGCGGIDAYFGTFSFINSAQLEALIKAIGQDAIPFLFMDAIDSMCPQCFKELSKLQDMLQKMNATSLNACQIDRGIFAGKTVSGLAQSANNFFGSLGTAIGQSSDWFAGLFGSGKPSHTAAPETTANQTAQQAAAASGGTPGAAATTAAQISVIGNNTWKGIVNNNVVALLDPANPQDAFTAEILMSVIGAKVVNMGAGTGTPVSGASAAGNSVSSTGAGSGNASGSQVASLHLRDLVDGKPNARYIQCQSSQVGSQTFPATGSPLDPTACRSLTSNGTTTLGSQGYVGVKAQVNCAIFGTSGITSQACPAGSGPGIVAEMQTGVPMSQWTALEQSIYSQSPIPFVSLMARLGSNPGMQELVASSALPYVQANVAANLGIALRNAITQTFQNGGKETYVLPPGYQTTMLELDQSIQSYLNELHGAVGESNRLATFVQNYLKSIHPYLPGGQ